MLKYGCICRNFGLVVNCIGAYNEHGEPDDAFNAVEELARGHHTWKYFCVVFLMPTRYTSWWSAEYLVIGVKQHN